MIAQKGPGPNAANFQPAVLALQKLIAASPYFEAVESESLSSANFSEADGRSARLYRVPGLTPEQLQILPQAILGDCVYDNSKIQLSRVLPLADPVWNWLFASNIQQIKGVGKGDKEPAVPGARLPTFPFFTHYNDYTFCQVEFTQRPYTLRVDAEVELAVKKFYWRNDAFTPGDPASIQQDANFPPNYISAGEWTRYCVFEPESLNNYIKAIHGEFVFKDPDIKVNNNPIRDYPISLLPDEIVKIKWYKVPYRYILSPKSYIKRFKGLINQSQFFMFPPGSLLYQGYKVNTYNPPVPAWGSVTYAPLGNYQTVATGPGAGLPGFPPGMTDQSVRYMDNLKLCDVELDFRFTNRRLVDPPGAPVRVPPVNRNFILSGWNLLPRPQSQSFHYAVSSGNLPFNPFVLLGQRPSYYSAPFELLFSNPDFEQSEAFELHGYSGFNSGQ